MESVDADDGSTELALIHSTSVNQLEITVAEDNIELSPLLCRRISLYTSRDVMVATWDVKGSDRLLFAGSSVLFSS